MLSNFIFSLNVSLPLFILMILGYFLRKKDVVNESFLSCANTVIFQVALPAKLFLDTAKTDFTQSFEPMFLLLAIGGAIFFFILFWLVTTEINSNAYPVFNGENTCIVKPCNSGVSHPESKRSILK